MSIRLALPEDSLQIATIHLESWRSAYEGIIPSAYINRITLEARLSHWTKEIASGESDLYVKVDRLDRVLGWMATGADREHPEDRGVAEVQAIYVSPMHTRQGIGRELFDHVMPRFQSAGHTRVVVWVLESNNPAIDFYHQRGFAKEPIETKTIERDNARLVEIKLEQLITTPPSTVPCSP
ncbi:Sortase-related acyltransferase [Pseudomonas syringae pv. syringae HS191]|uniref:GNAT family N-acetyltransferase n=1 Tax=Pseudomonas syringae TaxID=317 RepID=UPI0006246A0F|nr:GNAT family N-acetyltransferase [Pseudomonas syringae]AKF49037.1 Sortase-related acyltransferase [Pseudomonas syringae pv. syringae HS191]RML69571.1 GCN5-related N-acetyltransferase [Pseudomonas syringae pv. syringae]